MPHTQTHSGARTDSQISTATRICIGVALCIVGAWFAYTLVGVARINPTSTLWLNEGDIAQPYLGWHFFRGEPWMLPLGANPRYGLDMGSSIVFTDSIPLLAIPFKALRTLLPVHFQYAGIWMAFCFIAQGLCALLLLHRFTRNPLILVFGATLFVFSPVLVARALGHFALLGQWTLLLALWLYFTPNSSADRAWIWRALIAATALIHGYLLYFVLALWITTILRDRGEADFRWRRCVGDFAATVLALACVMWLAGWFELPFSAAASGDNYGLYAANLSSLVIPLWISPLLPALKLSPTSGSLESINYLGVGVMLLCVVGLVRSLPTTQWGALRALLLRHKYLLLTTIAFALLSFSHNMYWGETLIYQFPLNDKIHTSLELIRGSGRLLWLAHYLIILAAIVMATQRLRARAASAVVVLAVAAQAFDLYSTYRDFSRALETTAKAASDAAVASPRSAFWDKAAMHYQEVDFFPITHSPPRYERIALWAGDHHIAINTAYFGRVSVERAFSSGPRLETELTTGTRRPHTLYVIQNRRDVDRLVLLPDDGVGEIDGYWLVAPDWFKHAQTAADQAALSRPKQR